MVVLKLLDLVFLGLSAWERYDANRATGDSASNRIAGLRQRLLTGEITDAQAMTEIDALIDSVRARRAAAISRLPLPTYGVQEIDGD